MARSLLSGNFTHFIKSAILELKKMNRSKHLPKNKKIILILFLTFFGLVCFITPTRAATKTKTLSPTRDTYTNNEFPDTNYGSNEYLYVGNLSGGECRSYVQFSKSDLPSSIQEVYLQINITYISGVLHLRIYTMCEEWNESSVTYNNCPISNYFGHSSIMDSGQHKIILLYIDLITEFPSGNYMTFMLYSLESDYMYFASEEHSTLEHLALLVDYTATESNLPLIVGLVVGISAAIGVGAIVAFLFVKKKKGRIEPN